MTTPSASPPPADESVVLIDRDEAVRAVVGCLYKSDNRVTQSFGKPWIDDAAHAVGSIKAAPAFDALLARVARLEALLGEARGALGVARESLQEAGMFRQSGLAHDAASRIDAALKETT